MTSQGENRMFTIHLNSAEQSREGQIHCQIDTLMLHLHILPNIINLLNLLLTKLYSNSCIFSVSKGYKRNSKNLAEKVVLAHCGLHK